MFCVCLQENKAREVAEVQRRHRERLHCAAKRRSTATCSSRDKEMDGVALESVLQSFLTKRLYRRRSGRPLSSQGSPIGSSPENRSFPEIPAQGNLPENQSKVALHRGLELGKKEWNSAGELTEKCLQNKLLSNTEDLRDQCTHSDEEKIRAPEKENSRGSSLVNRLASISSSGRSFSANSDDGDDDLQDNNEEEAQKLREASRKVLRFQNSRGSVSSAELENQKSPRIALPRQRTFDEETQMCPEDPSNEDLELFFSSQPSSSKRNLGRRNTLPSKVLKTEKERGDQWAQNAVKSPKSAGVDRYETLQTDGAGNNHSAQVFDFNNVTNAYKNCDSQGPNSPLAEMKSSAGHIPDEGLVEQNREGTSAEPPDSHMQRNGENTPPKNTWIKPEPSGIFFNFFKRLGDMSKLQSSKETVRKGSDSGT